MLFKIDENLPIEIAGLFIDAGYDAKTVNDQQMQGAIDPVLIQVKLNNVFWLLLTLIFPTSKHIHQKNFQALLF